jgi:hypothetical protein
MGSRTERQKKAGHPGIQRSERLCFKDDKHYAKHAKAVKLLEGAAVAKKKPHRARA